MRRHSILYILLFFLVTSCAGPKPLYTWGSKKKFNYYSASYNYLKKSDEKSINKLKESYIDIIANQKGTRKTVPPGIYADYGFLLLSLDEADKGNEMLRKEIELYPESEVFISRILNMLNE
tara:strand:+ start:323 stop:685 length:363 start_codon:yes stop_codon:yes gene_type:complete